VIPHCTCVVRKIRPPGGLKRFVAICFYERRLRRDKMMRYDDPQRPFVEACEKEVQCLTKT
jgi:hypothetical protein